MKIKIIGSTKVGYQLPKEDALDFSGKAAGICYLPDTVDTLFGEPQERTQNRVNGNIKSGHHSVFGHPHYNFIFEGIPKILAMILNNEKVYDTSEKSARYTKMEPSPQEKVLYEKWINIYKKRITEVYPNLAEKAAEKLAQENARYLISVFTPATIMEHSLGFGQLNYILNWAKDYINSAENTPFSVKVKASLKEFLKEFPDLHISEIDAKMKNRSFSLFSKRIHSEEFGENYSVNYLASFAQLAQAQRHRTIYYEMSLLDVPQYYVPPIIEGTDLETMWLKDISSLQEYFPQGMLVLVNERGSIENFVLKCTERLCGCAQLEIMLQTQKTLDRYLDSVKDNPILHNYLLPYSKGARCTFPNWKCARPCAFGPKDALNRII